MIAWHITEEDAKTLIVQLAARIADLETLVVIDANVPPLCAEERKKLLKLVHQLIILSGA